jgi:hypothetical protein
MATDFLNNAERRQDEHLRCQPDLTSTILRGTSRKHVYGSAKIGLRSQEKPL